MYTSKTFKLCIHILLVAFSNLTMADDIKANISTSMFSGIFESDKEVIAKNFKDVIFIVEINQHQSMSAKVLDGGIRVYNNSSESILIADLQKYCMATVFDPSGKPINLPQKSSRALVDSFDRKEDEWIAVSAKDQKIVPFSVMNPAIALGREKIMKGIYKIYFGCLIKVKKHGGTEIVMMAQESGKAEFDFSGN